MAADNASLIVISPEASTKLKEIIDEQGVPDAYLRITVAPGGHGGAQYILGLEETAAEDDAVVDTGDVRVLIDSDSAPLMAGTSLDYVEGLQRSGFVVSNPNLQDGCGGDGCGCGGDGGGGGDGCGCGGDGCGCGGH